ncbi:NTPase [Methanobacterium petrolearium]|uniref:NTPase n=1 Tax=Methanobacterium petrolearium TaxID=710190 RepID=UPI001AE94CC2|nr:NTPase [Methanobacterium petrolearium]MBP1946159.1 nucleoside-triphosphatase [Methanobacterium petrolearium]BDZ70698.1 nucleoside triphosphatase [Methanobacterium petrolearium]
MNILITGPPGVGKTTVLEEIKKTLTSKGYSVGGIYCPEIREKGKRTGFNIIDIASGRKGVLASTHLHNHIQGPKVGKYTVNLDDIIEIGITAIENAIGTLNYIFIDEIAPMELKSADFPQAVWKAMDSQKTVIAVIHQRSQHPFILKVKNREDVKIFHITSENRDSITEKILESLDKLP